MGLSWQQGPLSSGTAGCFLTPESLPKKLLYAEPLRMRVRFCGAWIAHSENIVLLFEPGHYQMAYFPESDVSASVLQKSEFTTRHHELGVTSWYTVQIGEKSAPRGAWQHTELPDYASELRACLISTTSDGEDLFARICIMRTRSTRATFEELLKRIQASMVALSSQSETCVP